MDLALRYLDAKLGEANGNNLVTQYYYGHANGEVMSAVEDPNLIEAFALDNPKAVENANFSPRLTLPLSAPGVLAGFFMVFIPTIGEYVTPLFVGGSSGLLYSNIVQDFFTKAANWPMGSAMSMVMLATTLLLVLLAVRLVDVRRLVD